MIEEVYEIVGSVTSGIPKKCSMSGCVQSANLKVMTAVMAVAIKAQTMFWVTKKTKMPTIIMWW